jgi:hypothetical protein
VLFLIDVCVETGGVVGVVFVDWFGGLDASLRQVLDLLDDFEFVGELLFEEASGEEEIDGEDLLGVDVVVFGDFNKL